MLEQAGVNVKTMNIQKLKTELSHLEKQKTEFGFTYKKSAQNEKELQKQMQKLKKYLEAGNACYETKDQNLECF